MKRCIRRLPPDHMSMQKCHHDASTARWKEQKLPRSYADAVPHAGSCLGLCSPYPTQPLSLHPKLASCQKLASLYIPPSSTGAAARLVTPLYPVFVCQLFSSEYLDTRKDTESSIDQSRAGRQRNAAVGRERQTRGEKGRERKE